MGEHTLKVPMALHKLNRERLADRLRKNANIDKKAVVVLQGGEDVMRYCSDVTVATFRQVL